MKEFLKKILRFTKSLTIFLKYNSLVYEYDYLISVVSGIRCPLSLTLSALELI